MTPPAQAITEAAASQIPPGVLHHHISNKAKHLYIQAKGDAWEAAYYRVHPLPISIYPTFISRT